MYDLIQSALTATIEAVAISESWCASRIRRHYWNHPPRFLHPPHTLDADILPSEHTTRKRKAA